jgi:UDP-N-acetylglucosamine 2-epimerase (non-hydrolysing)
MTAKPKKSVLFIFGTRPEAIKLAPVIRTFKPCEDLRTVVCVTGQHRAMLDQVTGLFQIEPDFDLNLMTHNQALPALAGKAVTGTAEILATVKPDIVFVQGDTTTAFAAGFAAFLEKIPVAHVEAGLRSHRRYSPFPEEINRVLLSHLTTLHFAPTEGARRNLEREGLTEQVFVVGNTVVDALLQGLEIIRERGEQEYYQRFKELDFSRRIILVTVHRRESFGPPLRRICEAIRTVAEAGPDREIVYPVHPNPNVRGTVFEMLGRTKNIHLLEPLEYAQFIWMMSKSCLIITDSGGVQEEAPSLGVPVLVVREVTERAEGVAAGAATMVGAHPERIAAEAEKRLQPCNRQNGQWTNPYGDGKSSSRILEITRQFLLSQVP